MSMLRVAAVAFLLPVAVAAGQKTCKKGIPCGGTCISASKTCHVGTVTPTQQATPSQADTAALRYAARVTTGADVAAIALGFIPDSVAQQFGAAFLVAQIDAQARAVGAPASGVKKPFPFPLGVLADRARDAARRARPGFQVFDADPAPQGLEKGHSQMVENLARSISAADSVRATAAECSARLSVNCSERLVHHAEDLNDGLSSFRAARERVAILMKSRGAPLPVTTP